MYKKLLWAFLILGNLSIIYGQPPKKPDAAQLYESLQKLNFFGTALYIAAHPDDENTKLISYLSNDVHARTAYLSITRGDGGQNLIGTELRELLGVIRTQELIAARSTDGGQQRFTRANDFGYSKHPDETLSLWNKEEVMADVVWTIRKLRPDVIINRFDHRSPGTTHGHHTSSAILSVEAFDLAADPTAYPEQLKYVQPWQPKRLFFNTSWWFYGSEENFQKADKTNLLQLNTGTFYPLKGKSNGEIAALSRSQHSSQGFGVIGNRGNENEYLEFLKGDFPTNKNDLFDGITTSWERMPGGKAIGEILTKVAENFNFRQPDTHVGELLKAYELLTKVPENPWKEYKLQELQELIIATTGLFIEAVALEQTVAPGNNVSLKIEAINRSSQSVVLEHIKFESMTIEGSPLVFNKPFNTTTTIPIAKNAPYTSPYWLAEQGNLGMYTVKDQLLRGNPDTHRPYLSYQLKVDGVPFEIQREIVYKYNNPEKGEVYQPFEILPPVTVSIAHKVTVFPDANSKLLPVHVKAGETGVKGMVRLEAPKGWQITPAELPFDIALKNDEQILTFTVTPPAFESDALLKAFVTTPKNTYNQELITIDYPHIPKQSILKEASSKIVRLNLQKAGNHIGYLMGLEMKFLKAWNKLAIG